jgi:hypothetical protein
MGVAGALLFGGVFLRPWQAAGVFSGYQPGTGITQGAGDDLHAAVVSIQAYFGDDYAYAIGFGLCDAHV